MILYEMIVRRRPWSEKGTKLATAQIRELVLKGERPRVPDELQTRLPDVVELCRVCWDHDPANRPGFHEIREALEAIQ